MILMNWIRSDDGGFTAFQVQVSHEKLARFIHGQFLAHMQTIYCHEQIALAIYKTLATNASDPVRRDVFLRLADTETRQLARRAEMLKRLNACIPSSCDTLRGRIWRQLLTRLGHRYALAWIKHIKKGDIRRQMELARLLKTLSE
ncbi:MAG: hypothetical protein SNJ59_09100 [Aggregatilineales bacterium]